MTHSDPGASSDIDRRILEAVRSLDYGSVEIVVHDSQVVQIERREKVRLDKSSAQEPRPGKQQAPPTSDGDARPIGPRRSRQAGAGTH